MSLLEKSILLTSTEIASTSSSTPSSRPSSPSLNPVVDVALDAMMSATASSSASVISVTSAISASSSASSLAASGVDSAGRRSPLADKQMSSDTLSRSPSLSTDLDGSSSSNQLADVDPQIIEALRSKDRLYVLKLGELMEGLINDRRSRIDLTPSTSYQRLLVHRCSAYYKLYPESDPSTKGISVSTIPESRIPPRRICELVPAETKLQPAFKIMARNVRDQRSTKPHSQTGSVTGEDNDSDIEPSEAGSLGGRSNATGGSAPTMKKRPTIEEREAAYNEARSRIFMDFEEKEKEKGISASSSTASLVSGSGSTSAGGRSSVSEGDGDELINSPVTESERSVPVIKDREKQRRNGIKRGSGNNSGASSSRSIRPSAPPYTGSGPSSSRGSRAPSPSVTYPSHYEPGTMVPAPYDNTYNPPYLSTSPGAEYPPNHPYPYHPYQSPPPGGPPQHYYPPYTPYYPPYPYLPPQNHPSEPSAPAPPSNEVYGPHSPMLPMAYGHPPYGWPPNMPPPPQMQPPPPGHPMNHPPQHPVQSPQHTPNPLPSFSSQAPNFQNEHPPPPPPQNPQSNPYGYMQAPYAYPSYYPPPPLPHQPPGPQTMPQQPIYPIPRSVNNGMDIGAHNMNDRVINGQSVYNHNNVNGSSNNSSVTHSRASSRSSMSSGPGNGGKGRGPSIPPLTRGAWSYGPGAGHSGFQPYGGSDAVGPRLTPRRLSSTSTSSSGNKGRPSLGDEGASASTGASNETRRTSGLPPRPDWAVGLKPQPTLAPHNNRHHDRMNSNTRKVSPISPPRGQSMNGAASQSQQPPALHPTDFPPLSGSERETRAPAVAGAWTDSSVVRSAILPQKSTMGGPTALIHYSSPLNMDATNMNTRLEDTDRGFERPPPKGPTELFNPKSPRKPQPAGANTQDERTIERKNDRESTDATLANQIGILSLGGINSDGPTGQVGSSVR